MTIINKKYPLIIEEHPENYNGYPFITLLTYGEETFLSIIDNHDKNSIHAYVLDYCGIAGIDEADIINIANDWYLAGSLYPLSIEFAKLQYVNSTKILRTFNINYTKRIIGPLPLYNMDIVKKSKRKKRDIIDSNIPLVNHADMFSASV